VGEERVRKNREIGARREREREKNMACEREKKRKDKIVKGAGVLLYPVRAKK